MWAAELSREALELVEYIDKNLPEMGIEVNTHDKIYFCKKSEATEIHRRNEHFPDLVSHYRDVKEPIAKILFADTKDENILKLAKMLAEHPKAKEFDFIRSDALYYEILPKGINKGTVVKRLAKMLEIREENIITAGDNDNDVSMLGGIHMSFAVSNASEAAKKAASFTTVSNEEHAIAKIIYDIK